MADRDPDTPALGLCDDERVLERAASVRRALKETLSARESRTAALGGGQHACKQGSLGDVFEALLDREHANSPHTRRLREMWGGDATFGMSPLTVSPLRLGSFESTSVRADDRRRGVSVASDAERAVVADEEAFLDSLESVDNSMVEIENQADTMRPAIDLLTGPEGASAATARSLKRSQNRITELERELEERVGDCTVLSERATHAEESSKNLESDYWSLHERLLFAEEKNKSLDDVKDALKESERRLSKERQMHMETTASLSDVTKRLKELEVTSSVAAAREREEARLVAESEARELRKEVQAMTVLKDDACATASLLREQLSTELKKNELSEHELESKQDLLDDSVKRCRELEIQAEQSAADRDRMEKQMMLLKESTAIASAESMAREMDLTNKLKEEIEQRAALSNENIKKDANASSLESDNKRLGSEISRLTQMLNDANAARDSEMEAAFSTQTELTEAKSAVARLEGSMAELESRLAQLTEERETLRVELDKTAEELQSNKTSYEREKVDKRELQGRVSSLTKELEASRDDHEAASRSLREEHSLELNEQREKYSAREAEIRREYDDKLKQMMEENEARLGNLRGSTDRKMQESNDSYDKALREEREKHENELRQTLASSKQKLEETIEHAQAKLEKVTNDCDQRLQEQELNFKSIISNLNSDLGESKQRCQRAEAQAASLTDDMEELRSRNKTDVQEMRETHSHEKAELNERIEGLKRSHAEDIEKCERQSQILKDQIEREKKIYETSIAECEEQHSEAMAKQGQEYDLEIEAFKSKISALESDNEAAADSSETVIELRGQLELAENENKSLVKELEAKGKLVMRAERHLHEAQNAQKREREEFEILRLEYAAMKTRDVQKKRWVMALETELQIRGGKKVNRSMSQSTSGVEPPSAASLAEPSSSECDTSDPLSAARDIITDMEAKHDEETNQYLSELQGMSKTLTKVRRENEELVAQCKELEAENAELSAAVAAMDGDGEDGG